MMKKSKNIFLKTFRNIAIVMSITCATSLYAGNGNPGVPPTGTTQTDDNTPKVPLEGGLSILILGAAAFGIKKLRSKKELE